MNTLLFLSHTARMSIFTINLRKPDAGKLQDNLPVQRQDQITFARRPSLVWPRTLRPQML